ncbi:hypothetical protein MRX96_000175 [Rhipicephalus microplus]
MTAAPTGGYASPPQFDERSDKWPTYQVRPGRLLSGKWHHGRQQEAGPAARGASLELWARQAVDSSQHYIDRRSPPGVCRWFGSGSMALRRQSDQVKPRELKYVQGKAGDSRCLETAGGALAGGTPR